MISELLLQAQLKLSDGSMHVITTPMLVPNDKLTVDEIRETLMGFGEDAQAKMEKDNFGGILRASPHIKLHRSE